MCMKEKQQWAALTLQEKPKLSIKISISKLIKSEKWLKCTRKKKWREKRERLKKSNK